MLNFNFLDWLNPFPKQYPETKVKIASEVTPPVTPEVKYINLHPECKDKLTDDQKDELAQFVKHYRANEDLYKSVGLQADVPAIVVAAIHKREADCNFNSYLSNGDRLSTRTYISGDSNEGKILSENTPNTIIFNNWIDGAVFALKHEIRARQASGISYDEKDISDMLIFCEIYNGSGYRYRHAISPYVYACTSCYQKGKFTDDHGYDADAVDHQLGCLIMIRALIS